MDTLTWWLVANHQLPIAAVFWIIQIVSTMFNVQGTTEQCSIVKLGTMFKLNTKLDADSLLHSVILNAIATQYTCSVSGIYHPHWLVQLSQHCSHMRIPVHSPWLPGYIEVQTVLIILTMAGVFPDRPRLHSSTNWLGKLSFFHWIAFIHLSIKCPYRCEPISGLYPISLVHVSIFEPILLALLISAASPHLENK